ncbi:MAG: hypothetical protein DYG88_14315, partial [Chloroflexi bacterium CFX4]|nr:hypothetical protein [Chloroflexi bacterium CFX4]
MLLSLVGLSVAFAQGMIILDIQRISVASNGTQANSGSILAAISADGRYVAFESAASNLVSGDTNGVRDIFVHDRQTGQARVSVASDGTQANGNSFRAAISADGRYVAFESAASNLVSGDTNGVRDIFVHDRQTGQTSRVSVASDGTQGNGNSTQAAISADGRFVAFESAASNLVSGDTNNVSDIFVHDRQTGQTARVSVASDGTQGNEASSQSVISANGRIVTFISISNNLVSGDTNNSTDVFVHDRQTGQTTRVSVASDGTQANTISLDTAISADGRYVAFESLASTLVSDDTNGVTDIFVHDRQTGQTTRVSVASDGAQANGTSTFAAISADGRYVVFDSVAFNLVSGDTNSLFDVFIHDRQTGRTSRISVALSGVQGNNGSQRPAISADGRFVGFESTASNLVSGDTNNVSDIFVVEPLDTVPAVIGVLPSSGDLNVPRSVSIRVNFNEVVNFSPASFTLTCNGVPRTFSLNSSPNRVVILTPTIQLPANATCTVTAIADEITAVSDSDKLAGNLTFSFSTTAPTGKLETIGIFRPSDTTFYLRNSNTTGSADFSILFGDSSDLPVAGDWN